MSVRVERRGPVTTVILARPEVRNAVDGATAKALAGVFRAFDAESGESREGAARFAAGKGRHGSFS